MWKGRSGTEDLRAQPNHRLLRSAETLDDSGGAWGIRRSMAHGRMRGGILSLLGMCSGVDCCWMCGAFDEGGWQWSVDWSRMRCVFEDWHRSAGWGCCLVRRGVEGRFCVVVVGLGFRCWFRGFG